MIQKKLIFIRHAKSSWKDPDLTDYERPLNERGLRDAPFMAELLSKKINKIDLIITSGAERALKTSKEFQKVFNLDDKYFIINDDIYYGMDEALFNIIKNIDDKYSNVLLFGHNPALTAVCNYLSDKSLYNIPTCGIVQLDYFGESWQNITKKIFKFDSFEFPKKYFPQ